MGGFLRGLPSLLWYLGAKMRMRTGEGRKWLLGPTFRLAERKNTRTEKKLKFRNYGGRWAGQDMEVGGLFVTNCTLSRKRDRDSFSSSSSSFDSVPGRGGIVPN